MKKSSLLLTVLLVGTVGLSACGKKETNYTTAQMVDAIAAQLKADRPDQPITDDVRKQIEESVTLNLAVAQAATKEKIGDDETTKALIQAQTAQVLASQYFSKKMVDYKPTDDELKKLYDDEVKKVNDLAATAGKEYNLRHILVATEAEAKDIEAKLKAGEKFEELAKQSKDTASAVKGGSLGWSSLRAFVPEFAEVAGKLKSGEYSSPIKTQFGYHVIQLMDEPRMAKGAPAQAAPEIPPFDKVKPQILEMAKAKHLQTLQDGFKKSAAVAKPEEKKEAKK